MNQIGTNLEKLCQKAKVEILFVAPFIKASVLKQLLTNINPEVKVSCVTRWLPEDILAGVCDLEIWEVIQTFPLASLWVRSDLHAKYYRADNHCLVGSANLTAKALGWSNSANLELLVQLPQNAPELQNFEPELFSSSVKVTEDLFNQFNSLITQLQGEKLTINLTHHQSVIDSSVSLIPSDAWLPTLRNPEELYLAYSGEWDKLTNVARQAAERDLSSLPIVLNLTETAFKPYIGMLLLQKPIIQQIDGFVEIPQRFGAVCAFLASHNCADIPNFNPQRAWQTLMRWLLYFLPHRYAVSIPRHSEVFYRININ